MLTIEQKLDRSNDATVYVLRFEKDGVKFVRYFGELGYKVNEADLEVVENGFDLRVEG